MINNIICLLKILFMMVKYYLLIQILMISLSHMLA